MSSESRTLTLIGDYLEGEARSRPEVKDAFTELNAAVQKKLWHQVSTHLLSFLTQPPLSSSLLPLQEQVVSRLYKKLSPFDYVRWSVAVAGLVGAGGEGGQPNVGEGLKHLETVLSQISQPPAQGETVAEQDAQAILLLKLEITRRQLSMGQDTDEIKERLSEAKKQLDAYSGVMDAKVYAAYYQAQYEYNKIKGNPQEYYTNSLLYLTYTPLASLPLATQQSLASDIGLAALLGKNIYNFGELLQHPILSTLDNTEYAWLPKLLRTFNAGDIPEFNSIFAQIKDKYPTLAANSVFLNQKLRIMTLMELVFRLPSGKSSSKPSSSSSSSSDMVDVSDSADSTAAPRGRYLTFDAISKGCDIPLDQVEWLLMKALALKVIKGQIDQVAQSIQLKWVSPRVLDLQQVRQLQNKVSAWQQEVEQATIFVENNAQQVI